MKLKNILHNKKFILPLVFASLSVSLSFTPQVSGTMSLSSTMTKINDVEVTTEFLDCDKVQDDTCTIKVTARKGKHKTSSEYTVKREKTLKPEQQTEAGAGIMADIMKERETQAPQAQDTRDYFRVAVTNNTCTDCGSFFVYRPLDTKNLDTIKLAEAFTGMFNKAASEIAKKESSKLLTQIQAEKDRIEEEKLARKREKCEIDEAGESLNKFSRRFEKLECLRDKMWDLEDNTDMAKYFNTKIKGLLNNMLLSQNPEDRELAFEMLEDIVAESDGENRTIYSTAFAMRLGAQAMNLALDISQDAASSDPQTRLFANQRLSNLNTQLKHFLNAPQVRMNRFASTEAQKWNSRVEAIIENAIENPDNVARKFFTTDMELGYTDDLSLPLFDSFNDAGSPIVAPPTINGGRGSRSNIYNFGTTIPGLGQRMQARDNLAANNRVILSNTTQRMTNRNNLISNTSSTRSAPRLAQRR